MHVGLDDEEYSLLQAMIHHFRLQLAHERATVADLRRQLECAQERIALLESSAYGVPFL